MAPNVERPIYPYMQVVARIRDQIRTGQLREGDRVPSARQITKDWGVSLATATKVLGALQSEGLARGVPGVGTVVVGTAETAKDRLTSIRRTGRIYAPDEHAKITSADVVPAPEDVAGALGIEAGAPAIRRERITYRGEQPVSASTSWYDGSLSETAPLLLVAERIKQGTPRYIEEQTGRSVATGRDHVGARLATTEDAEALRIATGAPVLHGQNWFYDTAGDVIEYGQYRSAGERLRSYEYRVED